MKVRPWLPAILEKACNASSIATAARQIQRSGGSVGPALGLSGAHQPGAMPTTSKMPISCAAPETGIRSLPLVLTACGEALRAADARISPGGCLLVLEDDGLDPAWQLRGQGFQ